MEKQLNHALSWGSDCEAVLPSAFLFIYLFFFPWAIQFSNFRNWKGTKISNTSETKRGRENIIYNNNYVCFSTFKLGVGPFKTFFLPSYHLICLFLEAHFEAKLAFMVAEVVELWEVSGHVSGCTTCMLKATSRLGRFILVLIPSLLHSVLFDYCCCCLVAKSCLTLLWPHGL